MNKAYGMNSSVTVMTNIDNNRSSQSNYNKKKKSPYTQYGPYSNNNDVADILSANEDTNNHFEMLSAGGYSAVKAPATMQEFPHNRMDNIPDSMSDQYAPPSSNISNHHKVKNRFESMRKKNINNVANNILSNGKTNKIVKNHQMRTKSVDDEITDLNSNHNMVNFWQILLA